MEYQQLAPPPIPAGVLHTQAHHPQPPHQQQQQQQPQQPPVQPPQHPHIVVAPAHQQPQSQQPPPPSLPPASHGHQVHPPLPPIHDDSTSSRWSQYQHLWRQHHVYMNGVASEREKSPFSRNAHLLLTLASLHSICDYCTMINRLYA
ncbi:hypothetical protein X777_11548 [Ooceraea biroi]|uniref:Uncharacterized protein n=1 Tax=Ooceraea biroi TaxID=2015173 RepID=A0A026W210_OOCBI|nr:hypothetical protein X777_11548 [Ooceraea biroi]